MDCVIDVAGRSDKLAQAMVVFVLAASSGSHTSIITTAVHTFTAESCRESSRISDSRTGKWRELAQKTPECGDTQHGGNRGLYIDASRVIDFLLSRDEIDHSRIGVTGGSQGGGLTISTAALRPEVRVAAASAPFLCGIMDSIAPIDTYPISNNRGPANETHWQFEGAAIVV